MSDQIPIPTADHPKAAFRAWARGRLKSADSASNAAVHAQICAHLVGFLAELPIGVLLGYVPIRGEIDPIIPLNASFLRDWTLALPRCTAKEGVPLVQAVPAGAIATSAEGPSWAASAFEPDAWGVPAPRIRAPIRPQTVTAVLVPGLAFDPAGHRLGRGAGVYDRLLATLAPTAIRIGLVPADRMVPALPHEPHDIRMHVVVTQDGVTRCAP